LGLLSASLEHDIRNPVSVLLKRLKELQDRYQHDQHLQGKIEFIRDQVSRIESTVDVIPAMREDADEYKRHFRADNLVTLGRTAANLVKKTFEQVQPRISVEESQDNIRVLAYRNRLVQALVNILNNGVEACLRRGDDHVPEITIFCRADVASGMAEMRLRDRGTGIPATILPKITTAMFSTKTTSRNPNRGIGLFMASRIIRQHHGDLTFASDGVSYTEVTVRIPLYQPS
jgi:signal transduction histidine kinase